METGRAWLVFALGDERQYAGNVGYADELHSVYRYDNFVANHKQIAEGDLLILRDGHRVLGTARASWISTEEGFKTLNRCPRCDNTGIKRRKIKRPLYRCDCGYEFDVPRSVEEECVKSSAWFEKTFRPLTEHVPVEQVLAACPRYNEQMAMQELVLELLEGSARVLVHGAAAQSLEPSYVLPIAADASTELYAPDGKDEREGVVRQIWGRRGQGAFRHTLRKQFADTCLVTGCTLADLLEAAHINPYRGEKDNHPSNGLLLRTDIHTLFDLNLLGIEPESLRIHLHPKLKGSEYERFDGKRLACEAKLLSKEALELRWNAFQERLMLVVALKRSREGL